MNLRQIDHDSMKIHSSLPPSVVSDARFVAVSRSLVGNIGEPLTDGLENEQNIASEEIESECNHPRSSQVGEETPCEALAVLHEVSAQWSVLRELALIYYIPGCN
jgi:hypothetical protein